MRSYLATFGARHIVNAVFFFFLYLQENLSKGPDRMHM